MNDRFKFRAWDNTYKRFIFRTLIDAKEASLEWEQCTGLKDKNGRLIYEGDILGDIYRGFIKRCDECKHFSMFYEEHCFSCNGDILWADIVEKDGDLEVIGNIHENPELMEE